MLGMFGGDLPEPWTPSTVSFDHGQRLVHGGSFRAYTGKIANVKNHHRLGCRYDVELDKLDESGNPITIYECKQLLLRAGYDGISISAPLQEGEPVVILCTEGEFSEGTILGSYHLPGEYEEYYKQGSMGKPMTSHPGIQDEIVESNPGSVHPYRVQIPTAYNTVIPATNITSPHDDPAYYHRVGASQARRKDKVKARPQYAGLQHMSEACMVNYHMGPVALYSDTATLVINQSTGESRCARLERHAAYYGAMYSKLASTIGLEITVDDGPQTLIPPGVDEQSDSYVSKGSSSSLHGGTPGATGEWWNTVGEATTTSEPKSSSKGGANISDSLKYNDPDSVNYLEPLPIEYQMDQLYKLTLAYREAAKECSSAGITAKTGQAVTVQKQEEAGKPPPPSTPLSKKKPKLAGLSQGEIDKAFSDKNKGSEADSEEEVTERTAPPIPNQEQSEGTSAERNALELADLLSVKKEELGDGIKDVVGIRVDTQAHGGDTLQWSSGEASAASTATKTVAIEGQTFNIHMDSSKAVESPLLDELFQATESTLTNLYRVSPTFPGGYSTIQGNTLPD